MKPFNLLLSSPIFKYKRGQGITASGFNFHIRAGIGEIQCLRAINKKLKIPKSFPHKLVILDNAGN